MDSQKLPPIIFDINTKKSTLAIRNAAAIVIYNKQGKVFLARRSQIVEEFKGVWSLPSKFIENNNTKKQMEDVLKLHLHQWFKIEISNISMIGRRMALRPKWKLLMHLFKADLINTASLSTNKYDLIDWVDGKTYFSQFNYSSLGDCAKSYLDYLGRGDINS